MIINPPYYKTAEEMEIKIKEYFELCKGTKATDKDGNYIITKHGYYLYEHEPKVPSMIGLALYLGFSSRQALKNYKKRSKSFEKVLEYAKSYCEMCNIENLYSRDSFQGAYATLRLNYDGWQEKVDTNIVSRVVIVNDIPTETE